MPPQVKRGRSHNDVVDCSSLYSSLAELAKLKASSFDWGIQRYAKSRRSQGPDREGLILYEEVLDIIIRHAPACLPGHVPLRDCWKKLHREHDIKDAPDKSVMQWANDAAETLRLQLKHIRSIKESGSGSLAFGLEAVLAHVKLDESRKAKPKRTSFVAVSETTLVRRNLQAQPSDTSSVVFCGSCCQCPTCRAPINLDSGEDNDEDSVDAEATSVDQSVPAVRGMVAKICKTRLPRCLTRSIPRSSN